MLTLPDLDRGTQALFIDLTLPSANASSAGVAFALTKPLPRFSRARPEVIELFD